MFPNAEDKILDAEEKVAKAKAECERDIRNIYEKDKELRTHISDIGTKVLGTFKTDQFKKRTDFPSFLGEDEYKAYVKGHIGADMLVRCCKVFYWGVSSEAV